MDYTDSSAHLGGTDPIRSSHDDLTDGELSQAALRAIELARQSAATADRALDLVTLQAVTACTKRGMTAREVGALLELPTSSVKRILMLTNADVVGEDAETVARLAQDAWARAAGSETT